MGVLGGPQWKKKTFFELFFLICSRWKIKYNLSHIQILILVYSCIIMSVGEITIFNRFHWNVCLNWYSTFSPKIVGRKNCQNPLPAIRQKKQTKKTNTHTLFRWPPCTAPPHATETRDSTPGYYHFLFFLYWSKELFIMSGHPSEGYNFFFKFYYFR